MRYHATEQEYQDAISSVSKCTDTAFGKIVFVDPRNPRFVLVECIGKRNGSLFIYNVVCDCLLCERYGLDAGSFVMYCPLGAAADVDGVERHYGIVISLANFTTEGVDFQAEWEALREQVGGPKPLFSSFFARLFGR